MAQSSNPSLHKSREKNIHPSNLPPITIRFVRVAERILINRSWTEPRCLGCSLEIMGKEY